MSSNTSRPNLYWQIETIVEVAYVFFALLEAGVGVGVGDLGLLAKATGDGSVDEAQNGNDTQGDTNDGTRWSCQSAILEGRQDAGELVGGWKGTTVSVRLVMQTAGKDPVEIRALRAGGKARLPREN